MKNIGLRNWRKWKWKKNNNPKWNIWGKHIACDKHCNSEHLAWWKQHEKKKIFTFCTFPVCCDYCWAWAYQNNMFIQFNVQYSVPHNVTCPANIRRNIFISLNYVHRTRIIEKRIHCLKRASSNRWIQWKKCIQVSIH